MKQHEQDQLEAAKQDARRTFVLTATTMKVTGHIDGDVNQISSEVVARLLNRCGKVCVHFTSPRPAYVLLGLGEIVCDKCFHEAHERLLVQLDDQHCDSCGAYVPDNVFSEFMIYKGSVMVFGNRGRCCEELKGTNL